MVADGVFTTSPNLQMISRNCKLPDGDTGGDYNDATEGGVDTNLCSAPLQR